MSYSEILKTSDDGKYRVKLIQDDDASEPYDDGQSPLLRLEYSGYGWRAEHRMATGRPTDDDARIEYAAGCWGSELDKFEKYLRAFYGATEISINTSTTRGVTYITYDTDTWREYCGWTPDDVLPRPLVNMDEFLAWCVGECYGYEIEENVTWTKDGDPGETMETWEFTGESCWGYYGDYGREAALAEFDHFIGGLPAEPEPAAWAVSLWENFIAQLRQFRRVKR